MKTCDIIGISDSRKQWFPPHIADIIQSGKVFSGGRRHHEIMQPLLPSDAVWIDITVPLSQVFEQYQRYDHVVIFASGDPLFFGFANTVQRECCGVTMRVFPSMNSLQPVCVATAHENHLSAALGLLTLSLEESYFKLPTLI